MDHPYPSLSAAFERYAARFPRESDVVRFHEWLRGEARPFHRETQSGHFTGSAWLVSADGERVLLMHHRKLQRWLQLGGHADGDADLSGVALREAREESGLAGLEVLPEIFDMDLHVIPARRDEPEHWHYDVRYVVIARASEVFTVNVESLALAWRPIAELATEPTADPSLRRMAAKWLATRQHTQPLLP